MKRSLNEFKKWKQSILQVKNWLGSRNGFLLIFTAIITLITISYARHNPFVKLPVESQLGVLGILPPEYYIAIILSLVLLCANFRNEKKCYFFISLLLMIFTFVSLESVFQYNPVGNTDAYGHFIAGVSLKDSANPLFSYSAGNYPYVYFGSFLFIKIFSTVVGMSNSDIVPFLSIFKIITTLLFFSLLYFLLTKIMSTVKARLLTVIMVFANPYFQFHFSPHAFGLIVLLLLLYTVIVPELNDKRIYAVQLLLFAFLMVTHGPTTLYFALAYLFATILFILFKRKKWTDTRMNVNLPMAIVFIVGAFLMNPSLLKLLNITIGSGNPQVWFSSFANSIDMQSAGSNFFEFNALGWERFGNNYLLPEILRLLVLSVCLIITIWGILKILKEKRLDALNIFLIGAFGSTLILSVGNILYPFLNMGDRSFLYLIFGGVLLLRNFTPRDFSFSEMLKMRKSNTFFKNGLLLLTLFLIVSPMANGLAYHYNNGIYFTAPQYAERQLYVDEHSTNATIFSYRDNHGILFSGNDTTVQPLTGVISKNLRWFNPESPELQQTRTFIVLAESTEWSYSLQEEDAEMQEILQYANTQMNKIYASVGTSVWFSQP